MYSQTVVFKDKKSQNPIEGIQIEGENFLRYTNTSGELKLKGIHDSTQLLCTHVSYTPLSITKKSLVSLGTILLSPKNNTLPGVEISKPLRAGVEVEDEPHQIIIISGEDILNEKPESSADMLQQTGSIFVQKSQAGGGSPVLRGFEANEVLMVIDGVRMNNAIYRSGHLQNSITIDNSILSHTDIILGSNSVLYGSDALGGVIHFHTKLPTLSDSINKWESSLNSSTFFNSNNRSLTSNLNFTVAQNKWGFLGSVTRSSFNDYKMGKVRTHGYDDWGLQSLIYQEKNGEDFSIANPDPENQVGVGFNQTDILAKLLYKHSEKLDFNLNFQYSNSTNVGRYDKLVEIRNGDLRYAEWYYGPQKRLFGAFTANFKPNNKWINSGSFIMSYQRIDEDRITRLFNSNEKNYSLEDIHVVGLNLDLSKLIDSSKALYYGLEIQQNFAQSTSYFENRTSLERSFSTTRYPDGGSEYLSSGAYIEYKQQFDPKTLLTAGIRYSYIYANSRFEDQSEVVLPFDKINISAGAPSASVGVNYHPDGRSIIKGGISTGYRAPNIDDYGKVFENNGYTIVPNDNLKPEFTINGELSGDRFFGKRFFKIGGTIFYTYLINAIVREDFSLNGVDSIFYNGEMTKIQANVNAGQAFIYGLNVFAELKLMKGMHLKGAYNYTKGVNLSEAKRLPHIAPDFGKVEWVYKSKKMNTALYSYYNFKKPVDEYGGSSDNLEEATAEGTPAWWTLNYRFNYQIIPELSAQFYVTNILDHHYRQFSSAISAPGRSFKFGLVIGL